MRWSLSEFLQLLEIRSQCWCFVEVGRVGGFRVPPANAIFFYAMLDGSATLSGGLECPMTLTAGDIVFVISGRAHAIRTQPDSSLDSISVLDEDAYVDAPPTVSLGDGGSNRMLCGRLKVRWPAGLSASLLPAVTRLGASRNIINLPALVGAAVGDGAAALLTRMASMLFASALREHPSCQAIFHDASSRDPIARALQFMETHPFQNWTVAILARKVGMGRSTFAARFLTKVGKSPMEVLTELRMRLAVKLLAQTELKVVEIAERVGYRSESAFNRRFVAHYDMTPGKMRAQASIDNSDAQRQSGFHERRRSGRISSAWGMGRGQPTS